MNKRTPMLARGSLRARLALRCAPRLEISFFTALLRAARLAGDVVLDLGHAGCVCGRGGGGRKTNRLQGGKKKKKKRMSERGKKWESVQQTNRRMHTHLGHELRNDVGAEGSVKE